MQSNFVSCNAMHRLLVMPDPADTLLSHTKHITFGFCAIFQRWQTFAYVRCLVAVTYNTYMRLTGILFFSENQANGSE